MKKTFTALPRFSLLHSAIALSLVITIAALSGCGTSPDTRFITLSASPGPANPPPPATLASNPDEAGVPIQIGAVTLPSQLDRLALVRYSSKNHIKVYGFVQWAAPLNSLVRQTLFANLAARLPEKNILPPAVTSSNPRLRLFAVNITKFSAGADDKVTLKAHWSVVKNSSGKLIKSGAVNITVPVQLFEPDSIAAAMSAALGKFCDKAAEQL